MITDAILNLLNPNANVTNGTLLTENSTLTDLIGFLNSQLAPRQSPARTVHMCVCVFVGPPGFTVETGFSRSPCPSTNR